MNAHTSPTSEPFAGPPRLNEPAPAFDALTTDGRRTLSDYEGKWLILFSHPADFTPVCTTEFMGFAKRAQGFDAMDVALLGLSIDSHYAHIAWIRSIKETFDVDIPFPIIADLDMKVAQSYGMIQPGASDTQAVRATFVIDPNGILRAMIYYPMTVGRSVDEIMRLVTALKVTDQYQVATPEGWHIARDVIVPPPQTTSEADTRMSEEYDVKSWYYATKKLVP